MQLDFEKYPFEKLKELFANIEPNSQYTPLDLSIGEPQFPSPDLIVNAIKDNLHDLRKYPKTRGLDGLTNAQRGFVKRRFGVDLSFDELLPTLGSREVLFNFVQFMLLGKKEPVLAHPNPFYQIYEGAAKAAGAKIIRLNLDKKNNFSPRMLDLEKDVDLVIINSPNNPTGSIMSMDELVAWVELAKKRDFILLSDECYSEIYFDTPPPSVLEACKLCGNNDFSNVFSVNSASKRSSSPSLRSGFIAGNKDVLKDYLQYRTYLGLAMPQPLQHGAIAAWNDDAHASEFRLMYKKNLALAKQILGIEPPQGGFYLWISVGDDLIVAQKLLEHYNMRVLPGTFLSRDDFSNGYIRVALVYDEEKTKDALLRLQRCLKQ